MNILFMSGLGFHFNLNNMPQYVQLSWRPLNLLIIEVSACTSQVCLMKIRPCGCMIGSDNLVYSVSN